jgi:hypothetical protein
VLISLDSKKAFDSVDHKYIEETLIAYGFGPGFRFLRLSTETSLLESSLKDLPANQSKLREELSRATP